VTDADWERGQSPWSIRSKGLAPRMLEKGYVCKAVKLLAPVSSKAAGRGSPWDSPKWVQAPQVV
jgi:hypothetical protein